MSGIFPALSERGVLGCGIGDLSAESVCLIACSSDWHRAVFSIAIERHPLSTFELAVWNFCAAATMSWTSKLLFLPAVGLLQGTCGHCSISGLLALEAWWSCSTSACLASSTGRPGKRGGGAGGRLLLATGCGKLGGRGDAPNDAGDFEGDGLGDVFPTPFSAPSATGLSMLLWTGEDGPQSPF